MENRIEIKKRSAEGVVVWRIDGQNVTPNTVIAPERGITVLVTVDGESQTTSKECVANSLVNPGKGKKLLGGNKPYERCEIYAFDQSSEFEAEWGLGGPTAIACRDVEIGVDCTAVAFGTYRYKIESFIAFKNAIPLDKSGVVTRNTVREFLRNETTDIIRAYLAAKIAGKDLRDCGKFFGTYQEELMEALNEKLNAKGINVYSFGISRLAFGPEHEALLKAANKVKGGNYLNHLMNEGESENIDLEAKRAHDVTIPLMNAQNGIRQGNNSDRGERSSGSKCICPRCNTINEAGAIYCSRCGEKLHK